MRKLLFIPPVVMLAIAGGLVLSKQSQASSPQSEIDMPAFTAIEIDGETLNVAVNEVSFSLWDQCVSEGACTESEQRMQGAMDHPAVNMNYYGTQEFIAWFREKTDLPARLPTQIEWMHIAADHLPTPTMPTFTDPRLAWAADYDLTAKPRDKMTKPMGAHGENSLGIQDINGNVWEWTASVCADGNITGINDCSAGRVAMGKHVAVLSEFVGDPGNAGCGGGLPPSNLGLRLVY